MHNRKVGEVRSLRKLSTSTASCRRLRLLHGQVIFQDFNPFAVLRITTFTRDRRDLQKYVKHVRTP
jgi:hypothetical protein